MNNNALIMHEQTIQNVVKKIWKFIGIWSEANQSRLHRYYSIFYIASFVITFHLAIVVNLYFLPKTFVNLVQDLMFLFTATNVCCKSLTFKLRKEGLDKIVSTLQGRSFQPATNEGREIIQRARKFNLTYLLGISMISAIALSVHTLTPIYQHVVYEQKLKLQVCSYSFLPEGFRERAIYFLYLYQFIGTFTMTCCNVTVDAFFVGILNLTVAQLEILGEKLKHINRERKSKRISETGSEDVDNLELIQHVKHFSEVAKLCDLIQDVFNIALFVQIAMASCIICVSAFHFTLMPPWQYYIFLVPYTGYMVVVIMVPSLFGTRLKNKSSGLTFAVYSCDWTRKSAGFKKNMQIFVERTRRPITLTGLKIFPLSLETFTTIVNTAYSLFTLIRSQSKDNRTNH